VNTPVTDVTDSKERLTRGKLPRNIVITLGVAAGLVVGTLGFFYQTKAEQRLSKEAEEKKAEKLRERTSAPDNGGLEQLIRKQQDDARKAEREQREKATAPETGAKSPVMTASDFSGAKQGSPTNLAKENDKDNVLTSPIYKQDGSRLRRDAPKPANGTTGMTTPEQMRAQQQAAAAAALGGGGDPGAGQTMTSDSRFLKETAVTQFVRTGIGGKHGACTLTKGFIIPATFVGGLNSDKPGEFRATVTYDVYDTVTGTCKVIPAGATLVGTYSPDIAIGQEKLLAAMIRLDLPNGKWIPLLGMQAADQDGTAGISGDVNNHFWKIFGGALIIGVLEQHFNSSATAGTTTGPNGITTFGNTAGQVAANTAQTILNRNQNIRPTITTKPGQKMLVQVKHDIVLEPYRD